MTFAAELDEVRQEVRRGFNANRLRFWPKAPGVGNVAVTGTPTYAVYTPAGAAITSGNATATSVDGVTRIDVTIDASNTTLYALAEGYRVDLSWTYDSLPRLTTFRFDCVREPYVPGVGLNELVGEVAGLAERLTTQAEAQATGRTAIQLASYYGVLAWGDVRAWLREQAKDLGTIYPHLIVDRELVERAVIAQAVSRAFKAEGGGAESEERLLAEDWAATAKQRFGEMGPLKYDSDDDAVADAEVSTWRSIEFQRSW